MTPDQADKLIATVQEIQIKVARIEGSVIRYDGDLQRLDADVRSLALASERLKARVGMWSTAAGVVTGGVVSLLLKLLPV